MNTDMANVIQEKADRIRDVIRYIRRFKNALIVIYLDEDLIDSPLFLSHIKDICFIHEAGLKIIMVPGAAKRIDEVLKNAGIEWQINNGCRITPPEAMSLIKMAAFDVSNKVMTAFATEKLTTVIGNWVQARGKGIINGIDYGTSGEVDKLNVDSVQTVLNNGFIPIFPCIGWSSTGKPYNISSIELSKQIAVHLKADKLFFVLPKAQITTGHFIIPAQTAVSAENTVPALNLDEVDEFLEKNACSNQSSSNKEVLQNEADDVPREKIFRLLSLAKEACKEGVTRIHILDGSVNGTIPCEIFSDFGSGTMIYASNYGKIRSMIREDIAGVLTLMHPFVNEGILLPRTKESLNNQLENYIVYEIDGAIRACASLIPYPDGQMEIAGVAVDKTCSHTGIGPKLISYLIEKAKKEGAKSIFLLTTQTADWFEKLGFTAADVSSIPAERKALWTPKRGSKVMRLSI